MDLDKNLLIKPGQESTRMLKLKDWDPDYTGDKSKKDMECELAKISSQNVRTAVQAFCRQ